MIGVAKDAEQRGGVGRDHGVGLMWRFVANPGAIGVEPDVERLSVRIEGSRRFFRYPSHCRNTGRRRKRADTAATHRRAIARHSDVKITLNIYAHTNLAEMRSALGKLGDALGQAG